MRQLLCTFTNKQSYEELIDKIICNYTIMYDKVFVLSTDDLHDDVSLIACYNIESTPNTRFLQDTISVHRKRDTNTMYTINALNEAIKYENDGILDKNYSLNWANFRNSLLLVRDRKLCTIKTEIFDIIRT